MEEVMGKGKRWLWIRGSAVLILVFIAWGDQAHAQKKYPVRPVDIVVAAPAGGSTDLAARIVSVYVSKKWSLPVNVINKPGGNNVPGLLEVYTATPDGYTLIGDGMSQSYMMVVAVKNLPFKVMDRTFIASVSDSPLIIVVASSSPYKSLKDLESEAKKNPESFTWGSQGGSGAPDFATRQFFKSIGVDALKTKPVLVRGGSDSASLAAGGHIKMAMVTAAAGFSIIKGGLVRGLAVCDKKRCRDFPDIPTTEELGYPDIDAVVWNGISGPPNLPAPIVEMWEKELEGMVKDPEVITKMRNIGLTPSFRSSNETREMVRKKIDEAERLWGLK
jgi:tripartite-type tricarboxylate transporter receptor subunit TctC